jgi:hypothetical protein
MCYIARSGGLLLFVSILTSIAQLQSMTSIKLLHCAKSSPTKVYGFGTLNLVTTVWKTSFTIFLEHLPPQLEIAGLLQSSTPSCKDSQVNLTC